MSRGTLDELEFHPASRSAIRYILKRLEDPSIEEAFASCAIESNRLAEICLETVQRIKNQQPFSDRYILGLAWCLKEFEEQQK